MLVYILLTDLLALLLQHTPISCRDVYLVPGRSSTSNIQRCQEDIGQCLCHNMLFPHALEWCDTAARLYDIRNNTTEKTICR